MYTYSKRQRIFVSEIKNKGQTQDGKMAKNKMRYTKNTILTAQQKIKNFETQVFTEKDLRGLTKKEKEFLIKNDMKVQFDQPRGYKGFTTIYLFINRNAQGKKQLYGCSKKQSINPNGHDIAPNHFNYACFLILNNGKFDKYNYEFRFNGRMNLNWIFA